MGLWRSRHVSTNSYTCDNYDVGMRMIDLNVGSDGAWKLTTRVRFLNGTSAEDYTVGEGGADDNVSL